MKGLTGGRRAAASLCTLLVLLTPVLLGQPPAPVEQKPQAPPPAAQEPETQPLARQERWAFGFRVRVFPFLSLSGLDDNRLLATTTTGKTAYDWSYATTSRSSTLGAGPAFEVRLAGRATATAELIFSHLRYEKSTDTYSGVDDPATGHDERSHSNITEKTRARLWDLPVMLHFRGLRSSGGLSRLWVAGGVVGRNISTIRTNNEIKNADGSGSSNRFATQPARRNLLGAVVGVGFRFIDDFNTKVTPEVRYTRWSGATFSLDSTRSPKNQLEVGIGFTR